jgi:hypothetical protein
MFGKQFSLRQGAVSPSSAIGDLVDVWRGQSVTQRFWLLSAACMPAALIIGGIIQDVAKKSVPPPPEIIYVESWRLDRSMADILKDQKERQRLREIRQAEVRERYKAIGRASGMDVDAIERKAKLDDAARAAEKAKAEAEKPAVQAQSPAKP